MIHRAVLLTVSVAACATVPKGDIDLLKPAIESFHQQVRWKDFRAAADRLVPERRGDFIKARLRDQDDRDLFITDFQLEDAQVAPDQLSATVVSKLSWYRLPSSTEQSAVITSTFVWRDSMWLLESQDEGPFAELKPRARTP